MKKTIMRLIICVVIFAEGMGFIGLGLTLQHAGTTIAWWPIAAVSPIMLMMVIGLSSIVFAVSQMIKD